MTLVSTLGRNLDQINRLKDLQAQLGEMQIQLATGKIAQRFKGLESNGIRSQRARADYKSLESYKDNIMNADRRLNIMIDTMEEFKAQMQQFASALGIFQQEGIHQDGEIVYYDDPATPNYEEHIPIGTDSADPSVEFETLRGLANNMFEYLVDLVNSKDGNRYVLSGAQTLSKPLFDTGLLDTAINKLIGDWKDENISSEDLVSALTTRDSSADPDAITDTVVGYSAELSAGNVRGTFVRVDDFSELDYTVLATEDCFRDTLVALNFIRNDNLPPLLDEQDPDNPDPGNPLTKGSPGYTIKEQKENFYKVFNAVRNMVQQSLNRVDEQRFKLEQVRANIAEIKEDHELVQNSLLETISNVEDADMNEVALNLNFMQVRMEASYRVTAALKDLNLVNYI
jgi:flagellin-like hook-associated protein FlgL